MNPEFLFRVERDPAGLAPGSPYEVSGTELASRLSFFLWSSIPDPALLDAAAAGQLTRAGVAERQASRLLPDARSSSLVTNFAQQWLHLRNLAGTAPDMRLFPDFDDNVRQSLRRETEMLFEDVMRRDRSIFDLLAARYTFLNERLAKHYGVAGIYGDHFRRVDFPPGDGRGGLLRHGSILTVTSYATRTSPVIRGKWVLDNIVGVPPPPPPPEIPALKERESTGKPTTLRERLALHRANPACSGCHNMMDPVGFAFERYDAVGRWRLTDDGLPLDTAGTLWDGSKLERLEDLEAALLRRPEVFATTFAEKLLMFALGRGLTAEDGPAVRRIVREAGQHDYRFSSFVLAIVRSVPFRMRRTA